MSAVAASSALLQVSRLNFAYPGLALFTDFSAAIPAGVTLVRGGDGRGKTTLLQLLAGLMPARDGVLELDGIRLDEDSEAYRRRVFYIDPRTEAYEQLTPPELFGKLRERFPAFDDSRLPALVDGLSLAPHLEKKLFMLSTGSKRKVYLAAAFAANATLTLLDDPFASLDRASINFVTDTLNARAGDARHAWVAAMYEAPAGIALASVIELGD
ncbi:ATP-binding cassette domain-containing protein [Herbaspirillum sp. WKF16]|jgi:ABC-type multidrug transport system ATPase subunit|uniref:ABC transporter ATP-binding protein n=1 Tax=Herbaspirillum sp. WKF16 TaxID=3028312 RepID=UPI0023A9D6EB|nr:ATP-binding cassette domain-containing protein [Herbaspirillum sp. WKF16]WDZ96235.1 ATP-binding cassette domain-containing protein [Herbaspirillum sp. WKF16]